jgi:hypothetical protein
MRCRLQLGLVLALLLAGTVGFVGCGVRGSLETPPQAKDETGEAQPGRVGEKVPHKPSILDPLIR